MTLHSVGPYERIIDTCPNACRQSARSVPSAKSTGKFLLKSEPK